MYRYATIWKLLETVLLRWSAAGLYEEACQNQQGRETPERSCMILSQETEKYGYESHATQNQE
jgi:hypothetical protein